MPSQTCCHNPQIPTKKKRTTKTSLFFQKKCSHDSLWPQKPNGENYMKSHTDSARIPTTYPKVENKILLNKEKQQQQDNMVVSTRKNGSSSTSSTENWHCITLPQPAHSQTPGLRWNHISNIPQLLVARNECLDNKLCERMRHLSTEQKPHTSKKNPHLSHSGCQHPTTIQGHSNGSDHPTS